VYEYAVSSSSGTARLLLDGDGVALASVGADGVVSKSPEAIEGLLIASDTGSLGPADAARASRLVVNLPRMVRGVWEPSLVTVHWTGYSIVGCAVIVAMGYAAGLGVFRRCCESDRTSAVNAEVRP
jgi:hypothetical protein